jgi:hypothetical protein
MTNGDESAAPTGEPRRTAPEEPAAGGDQAGSAASVRVRCCPHLTVPICGFPFQPRCDDARIVSMASYCCQPAASCSNGRSLMYATPAKRAHLAARTPKRDQAASDGGHGEEPLDDHASDLRNRLPEGLTRAPLDSATCLDSVWPAHIGTRKQAGPFSRFWPRNCSADLGGLSGPATSAETTLSTAC